VQDGLENLVWIEFQSIDRSEVQNQHFCCAGQLTSHNSSPSRYSKSWEELQEIIDMLAFFNFCLSRNRGG